MQTSFPRPLRIGLIGCGKMGIQHLKAIAATPGATVVGVADPVADPEQLKDVLPSGARLVPDAATLFAELSPDVVHIVTPPATHAPLALQAIEAGCHVYVEKPFTATRAEAERILAFAAERGKLVCPGHQYLFEKPALLALELLPGIGRVVHVESFFSFRTARRTITPVDQAKDILPHAVYPLTQQLRAATGIADAPIRFAGLDVRADGDVYALLRLGDTTGLLVVTLNGRPIEQYQKIVGTNGALRADYITGSVTRLFGPGTGPGILFTPYRRAFQTITGATRGFYQLIFKRKTSYPGLLGILDGCYRAVANGTPAPLTPGSILDTVDVCEQIGRALDAAEAEADAAARLRLAEAEARLRPIRTDRPLVLLTGGTGLLGRRIAAELRAAGIAVRTISRRQPAATSRVPGVEYVTGDLARGLDPAHLAGVGFLVHCAAETAGTPDEHRRNSVEATKKVFTAAADAGVRRAVHISSLAVLKPGHEVGGGPLDERTPIDAGNLGRGPYVWGKAESEVFVRTFAAERGMAVKILRPGPLVDYAAFQPPGRLGRELGPWLVAIGGKRTELSVCDIGTAARVVRSYVDDFDAAPELVNLVEAPPPTRGQLAARFVEGRPDLKVRWVPGWLLRLMSGPLKLVQRVAMGSAHPVDVYAAFASERYRTDAAAAVITRAGASAIDGRGSAT